MSSKFCVVWSSVGKKVVTGLTGFLLVGFVVAHLIGNLTLLLGKDAFNGYAEFLEQLGHGYAVPLAEVGLIAFFGSHIVAGLSVAKKRGAARPEAYAYSADAGAGSRKSLSSQSMVYTGSLLALFLVVHVLQFKFGAHYDTNLHGSKVRDLYRLVAETFANPVWVAFYVGVMAMLGLHLRHGLWSMFQSLGLTNKRLLPVLVPAAVVMALLLAVGFITLPVYLHLYPAPTANATTGGTP